MEDSCCLLLDIDLLVLKLLYALIDGVILYYNPNFGRLLVVMHMILSMFGKSSVHAWSRCGGLN